MFSILSKKKREKKSNIFEDCLFQLCDYRYILRGVCYCIDREWQLLIHGQQIAFIIPLKLCCILRNMNSLSNTSMK